MRMVGKILVATDGSEASDNALEYAIERAQMSNSELLILKVIRTSLRDAVIYEIKAKDHTSGHLKDKYMHEQGESANKILEDGIKKAEEKGVKAEGLIRVGLPDREIISLAKERNDVELIVMGAYGKNFLERQLVGSKTEGVLRGLPKAGKPLVVVPLSTKGVKTGGWILAPTDGSEPSDKALEYAIERAKMSNGNLLVLNVIKSVAPTSYHGVSVKGKVLEEQEQVAKRTTARSVNSARTKGIDAEGLVRRGEPDKEIISLAKELDDIELIVMGAYGKGFLERQFVGSKTETVLRAIPEIEKPLVVVCGP
jgi:nucleotide-binding universal stress UspA family protein